MELNCAALTETLLESELFGHEKGAFTDAASAKPGLLEMAHGGLRVIEDSQLRRVGGLKARPIDVRFVAATNRELEAQVEQGAFRRDLCFRLNGVTIVIPPLPRADPRMTAGPRGAPPRSALDSSTGDALFPAYIRKGSQDEQRWIMQTLERAGGNQTVAARMLGISRRTLVSRLSDYEHVDRPRKKLKDELSE